MSSANAKSFEVSLKMKFKCPSLFMGRLLAASHIALVALLALILCSSPAMAQVQTADIVGRIADMSHAVIPGAAVTVTNLDTGLIRSAKANATGEFIVSSLPIGRYSVKVVSEGFETYTVPELILSQGDRARIEAAMVVGATTTVTVSSADPALQTDSSVLGAVVTQREVEDLPLDGRNFMELAQILAGSNEGPPNALNSGTRPDDRRLTSSVSVNGQDENANNQLIDGMDNNERIIGAIGVRPDIDAIQEFRVERNLFTAEVGRTAGAVINIITKGGSNAFHGTLYEFFRNDVFDATNYFDTFGKSELRQNQYGASLGGPLRHNKLFFFADYEGYRQIQGSTSLLTVPSCFEQEPQNFGSFSDYGAVYGGYHTAVPASAMSSIALAYWQLYPLPNVMTTGNHPAPLTCAQGNTALQRNFEGTSNKVYVTQTGDGRLDYTVRNGDHAFLRYTINQGNVSIPGELPLANNVLVGATAVPYNSSGGAVITGGTPVSGVAPGGQEFDFAGTSKQLAQSAEVDYLHLFSANLVGEGRIGYTYIDNQSLPLNYGRNLSQLFGLQGVNTGTPETSGLTEFAFDDAHATLGDGIFLPLENRDNTIQGNAQFTLTHGQQQIKFGASLIRRHATSAQSSYGTGLVTFNSYTSANSPEYGATACSPESCFLRAEPYEEQRINQLVQPGFRAWEPSGYLQDDYRARPNLTLNLGIRYDLFTPFTEAHNHLANFDPYTNTMLIPGINAGPTAGVHYDYYNVAPRAGFAYLVHPDTVVRGGFGLTYIPISSGAKTQLGNPPYVFNFEAPVNTTPLSIGLPVPTVQPAFNLNASNVSGFTLAGIDPHYRSTYIEQFNLTVQQQFGRNSLEMTYVGEIGKHLRQVVNFNLAAPSTGAIVLPYASIFPGLTTLNEMESEGYSSYNAMQVTFIRRFTSNFGINANYTWAHGLNNSPNYAVGAGGNGVLPFQTSTVDYGNSDLDIRYRAALLLNYSLPFGQKSRGLKARVIKGWQVNLIGIYSTGQPFSVIEYTDDTHTGITTGERAELIGNPLATPPATAVNASTAVFNTAAFTYQPVGQYIPSERNLLYGPHYRTANLSLFKTFPVHDHVSLQFRAESFNVTNTPSFANPDGGLSDSTFGTISSTQGNYVPREIQLALKLLF